jgi:hypothetical protein
LGEVVYEARVGLTDEKDLKGLKGLWILIVNAAGI